MSPLGAAKAALLGANVEAAIGDERTGSFKGYPGVYRIVGLTAKTVIVAPVLPNDELNLRRKVSIRLDTGESRSNGYGVRHRLHPSHLAMVKNAFPKCDHGAEHMGAVEFDSCENCQPLQVVRDWRKVQGRD